MSNDDARLKRSLDFSWPDALALLHGMQMTATEAVLERKPLARRQFEALAAQLKTMIPAEADMFDALELSELGAAMRTARVVRLETKPLKWQENARYWHEGQIEISIEDQDGTIRLFRTAYDKKVRQDDAEKVRAVAGLLEEIAPLGVEFVTVLPAEEPEFEDEPTDAIAP